MLQDYKYGDMIIYYFIAASIYDLAKKDYIQEKYLKFLAGVQEMIGITSILVNMVFKYLAITY